MTPTRVCIVTITYNAQDTIERTLRSISAQTRPELIEHIVVDGASTDQTVDIVKNWKGHRITLLSEPDDGLYDAMNKGLALATAPYIWYVNSGDEVASPETVDILMQTAGQTNADVLYGDTLIVDSDGKPIGQRRLSPPENLTWKSFRRGMLVSHQSFIVKKSIAPKYDTQYKLSADFDWCVRSLKTAERIVNTHKTLSHFLDGGITKQNIARGLRERFDIMTHHYGLLSTVVHHVPIAVRFFYFWLRRGWF